MVLYSFIIATFNGKKDTLHLLSLALKKKEKKRKKKKKQLPLLLHRQSLSYDNIIAPLHLMALSPKLPSINTHDPPINQGKLNSCNSDYNGVFF